MADFHRRDRFDSSNSVSLSPGTFLLTVQDDNDDAASPVGISLGDEIVLLNVVRCFDVLRLKFGTVGDAMAKTVAIRTAGLI